MRDEEKTSTGVKADHKTTQSRQQQLPRPQDTQKTALPQRKLDVPFSAGSHGDWTPWCKRDLGHVGTLFLSIKKLSADTADGIQRSLRTK